MSTATEVATHAPPATPTPTWPPAFAERYRAAGWWTGETFGQMLRERAGQHPDRIAIVDLAGGGRRWTYADLDRRADRLAAGFVARGITKGDRVIVQLPNVAEFFEVAFALFRIGALPVFALPTHSESEIRHFCALTEAVAHVIPAEHGGFDHRASASKVRAAVPSLRHVFVTGGDPGPHEALSDVPGEPVESAGPESHEPAFLQLSGGATGIPKLIPRTHDDYLYSLRGSNGICGVAENSVYLCVLPAAHSFPLSSPGTFGALYAGARVVLCPQPTADAAFALIERERVTLTGVVPPLALAWTLAAPLTSYDLSSLDVLLVGGAKFSETVARRVRPALGCALQQVFAMAEGPVTYTRLDDPVETVVTTQGLPISPGDEMRVVDDEGDDLSSGESGQLLVRGPHTVRGYWNAPERDATAFTEDGFHRTGDFVRLTAAGHLVVEGRAEDRIVHDAEKIAAEEVENHLLAHPAVHDANVVAEEDPYGGERTCAYVILRAGAGPVKAAAMKRFVRRRGVASYELPDRVVFVDAFPPSGGGEVAAKELRADAGRRF